MKILLLINLRSRMYSTVNSMIIRFTVVLSLLFCILLPAHAENCTVNAGVDQTICPSAVLSLNGTAAGLLSGQTTWSQVSGPAVIITSPNALITTVTGCTAGNVYKFWLSTNCEDGTLIHDEVIITVKSLTTANAGPDQTLCPNPLTPFYAGNLAGNVPGSGETGVWSVIGSNNGVTVITSSLATSSIKLDSTKTGITTLRWTLTKTGCSSTDDVNITNSGGAATINAGPDQILDCYTSTATATMAASYSGSNGGQSGLWSVVSGPNNPTITTASSRTTTVTNLVQGIYKLRWTVTGTLSLIHI